jgi:hypothetical protein
MNDKDLDGRLVYLTVHLDRWLREVSPGFNVTMANKMAKVIKVFDWDIEEGKLLLDARAKTGKWKSLNSKDFKFVLKVYHPDLTIKKKKGCTLEEVLPRCYPGTELYLFDLVPDWMLEDLKKSEKDALTLTSRKRSRLASGGVARKKRVAR